MTEAGDVTATAPVPERVLRQKRGLESLDLAELWRYRELFVFLSWRDILVRYKQTYLGILWAVLQPLLTTFVFVAVFGGLAGVPSYGVPRAVMTLAALLPWQFFSNALTESSNSVVASTNLISKIYFPRLIIPASSVLSGVPDFLIGAGMLFALMLYTGVAFRPEIAFVPLFLAVGFAAALAAGVWLSALNVKYRDVKYTVPFFTRIGLYASPIGYPSELVRDKFGEQAHFWYCALNPMTGVIDGFRWAVLGNRFVPDWPAFAVSTVFTLVVLIGGLVYFRNTEKKFADVI